MLDHETLAPFRIIRANDLVRTPWRNGGGTSRDIAASHTSGGAMLWQVGIADLERDGPFSSYPHCDRIFTPIAGEPPPELAFHGGPFKPCPLLIPNAFSGEWPTLCRIPAPGQAFNAVFDRRYKTAVVTILHLADRETVILPNAATLVLHALTATLAITDRCLWPGDSLVASQSVPITTTGAGVAILVAITSSTDPRGQG